MFLRVARKLVQQLFLLFLNGLGSDAAAVWCETATTTAVHAAAHTEAASIGTAGAIIVARAEGDLRGEFRIQTLLFLALVRLEFLKTNNSKGADAMR